MYRGKRILDISIALPLFILVLPIIIIATMIVAIVSGSFPLFLQKRPGLFEKPFTLYKIKSLFPEDQSRSKFRTRLLGYISRQIRSYSIDELPQLLNVLKGDMSLVGPRPLLMEYLPLYNAEQRKRHATKPGISGWAQVHGRNCLDWPQRFAYDMWYVQNQSLSIDIKVLQKTARKVFLTKDVKAEGLSESEKFKGNG